MVSAALPATSAQAHSPFARQGLSAVSKLRAAMTADVVKDLERLQDRVAMVSVARVYEAPLLANLLQAALEGDHLQISYESRRTRSERLIYPYGVYTGLGFWYCACFDYRNNRHASLRADRILSMERVEGLEPPTALTIQEWLKRPQAEGPTMPLHATLTPRGMTTIDWSAFGGALTLNGSGEGDIDTDIPATSLGYYSRIFLQLGGEANITSPPELIDLLCIQARALLATYGRN